MKVAFWALFVAGLVACQALGIGKTLARVGGDWTAWPMVAGALLGVVIIGLAASFGTGIRPATLATDRAMLVALGGLIVAKVGVSLVSMISSR